MKYNLEKIKKMGYVETASLNDVPRLTKALNEKTIEAKGPEQVSFYELVGIAIQRLEDSSCSEKKKNQAATCLLNMARVLDRHSTWTANRNWNMEDK